MVDSTMLPLAGASPRPRFSFTSRVASNARVSTLAPCLPGVAQTLDRRRVAATATRPVGRYFYVVHQVAHQYIIDRE